MMMACVAKCTWCLTPVHGVRHRERLRTSAQKGGAGAACVTKQDSVFIWGYIGNTAPCRMTGVILHGIISPELQRVRHRESLITSARKGVAARACVTGIPHS